MPTPDLVLPKPYVLILAGQGSVLGGTASGTSLNFGQIVLIFETSDAYVVNDNVSYNPQGQVLVTYDDVQYAMVREEAILNKEIPPP